jgi:hypothetical protein
MVCLWGWEEGFAGGLLSGSNTMTSRPSGTLSSPGAPASNVYSILAFCSGPCEEPFGVLPGSSLM